MVALHVHRFQIDVMDHDPPAAGKRNMRRHDNVDGVSGSGRVRNAEKARRRPASKGRLWGQAKRGGSACQLMVRLEPRVCVHIVIQAHPGVAAELSGGQHQTIDGQRSAEHLKLELLGPVWSSTHTIRMTTVRACRQGLWITTTASRQLWQSCRV